MLGTAAELVALTDSTTRGCQIVIAGLGLGADDEVVTTDQEHFGLLGPLHASGARVVVTEADEDALLAAVTPRTRLIAVSHVLWTTGRRLDLARLRRPDGPPLLVDGAQSAGAIPVDLAGADFYTVSRPEVAVRPRSVGCALRARSGAAATWRCRARSRRRATRPTARSSPKDGARRFDSGWIGAPALAGLEAALGGAPGVALRGRPPPTAARCRELLEPLVDVVTPPGTRRSSPSARPAIRPSSSRRSASGA